MLGDTAGCLKPVCGLPQPSCAECLNEEVFTTLAQAVLFDAEPLRDTMGQRLPIRGLAHERRGPVGEPGGGKMPINPERGSPLWGADPKAKNWRSWVLPIVSVAAWCAVAGGAFLLARVVTG